MKSKLFAIAALLLLAAAIIMNIQSSPRESAASVDKAVLENEDAGAMTIGMGNVATTTSTLQAEDSVTSETSASESTAPSQAHSQESQDSLETMSDIFFKEIPKISSIKGLTEADVHRAPKIVLEAGEHLAEAREFFVKNPQPADVEMKFYLKCANNDELFDSVRAVCAARAQHQFKMATGQKMSLHIFESRIARLSQSVDL